MSSDGSVKTDGTLLSRLDQAVFRVESFFNILAGLFVLLLMFLAFYSVIGRIPQLYWLTNTPYLYEVKIGYADIVEQLMPVLAFLGLAYTQRLGGHIRMDVVVGNFRGRLLWAVEMLGILLMIFIVFFLIIGSYQHALRALTEISFSEAFTLLFNEGFISMMSATSLDSSGNIFIPTWPAKIIVPIALSVLLLRLILQLWGYNRAFLNNDNEPVAVPLIEDAATQAMHEAETVEGADFDQETK